MSFEYDIIRFIQNLRSDFMDTLMLVITQLGDRFVFIIVALVMYWFFNKKLAFKMIFVFIFSAITNLMLKSIVMRPRPFKHDISLNVGPETHGYSFPSGHSQNTGVITTSLYLEFNKKYKWLKYVLISILILVPFSRVYLGQHFLTDVLAGLTLGIIISLLVSRLVDLMGKKEHIYGLLILIPLLSVVFIVCFSTPSYDDYKDLFIAVGGLTGFLSGYYLDKVLVKYNNVPNDYRKIFRLIIGIVLVLTTYLGFDALFKMISDASLSLDFIKYLLVGLVGSVVTSFVFKKLKV